MNACKGETYKATEEIGNPIIVIAPNFKALKNESK